MPLDVKILSFYNLAIFEHLRHNIKLSVRSFWSSNICPLERNNTNNVSTAGQRVKLVVSDRFYRFYDDLPFCWMLITMVFIAFNKVCTSQYFVWFICLLPIAQRSIEVRFSFIKFILFHEYLF